MGRIRGTIAAPDDVALTTHFTVGVDEHDRVTLTAHAGTAISFSLPSLLSDIDAQRAAAEPPTISPGGPLHVTFGVAGERFSRFEDAVDRLGDDDTIDLIVNDDVVLALPDAVDLVELRDGEALCRRRLTRSATPALGRISTLAIDQDQQTISFGLHVVYRSSS